MGKVWSTWDFRSGQVFGGTRVDQIPLSQGDGDVESFVTWMSLKMGIQTPTSGLMNIPYYMKKNMGVYRPLRI